MAPRSWWWTSRWWTDPRILAQARRREIPPSVTSTAGSLPVPWRWSRKVSSPASRHPRSLRDRHRRRPARRRRRRVRSRARPALRLPAPRARRAGLDAAAGLARGVGPGVGEHAVAARPLREERQTAPGADGRPAGGPLLRRPGARPGRAGDHVDARAAADDEHDGLGGPCPGPDLDRGLLRRPGPRLHAPGLLRPPHRLAQPPPRHPRLAARARHVGRRGSHAPLPDEGAGRAAADLPAVLRALHPDGPRRQLDPDDRQAEVRPQAGRPLRRDVRLPAPLPRRARRRGQWRGRREHAVQEPRGLRGPAARHREHPRHPARDQGADGTPSALAAG